MAAEGIKLKAEEGEEEEEEEEELVDPAMEIKEKCGEDNCIGAKVGWPYFHPDRKATFPAKTLKKAKTYTLIFLDPAGWLQRSGDRKDEDNGNLLWGDPGFLPLRWLLCSTKDFHQTQMISPFFVWEGCQI